MTPQYVQNNELQIILETSLETSLHFHLTKLYVNIIGVIKVKIMKMYFLKYIYITCYAVLQPQGIRSRYNLNIHVTMSHF